MPPNVVLVTIDCLRTDHVSCLGYPRVTTPNIDDVAKESIVFTRAFSNGPYTTASFPSIFTSTISLRYYGKNYPLCPEKRTLAEILNENGFTTAAFHSNPLFSSEFGYDRGFTHFEDVNLSGQDSLVADLKSMISKALETNGFLKLLSLYYACLVRYQSAFASAKRINEKVFSWFERDPDDFFLWVHYMDVHSPYIPGGKYRNRFCRKPLSYHKEASILYKMHRAPEKVSPAEVEALIDLYDAEVSYVDECVGDLMRMLRARGTYDESLVVITADHGEEFKEHGGFGHKEKLYDELLHVPLIVKMPSGSPRGRIDKQCSLLDLTPTIIDVLNLPIQDQFKGASLLPLMKGKQKGISEVISACGIIDERTGKERKLISVRTEEWKYIFREGAKDELYNLQRDPSEQKNVIEAAAEKAAKLKSKLIEKWPEIYSSLLPKPLEFTDEDVKRRLKALGYL